MLFYSGKRTDGQTDAEESSPLIILKERRRRRRRTSTWQFGPVKEGHNKFSSPEIYLSLVSFIFGIKVHQSMSNDLNITHAIPPLSSSTSLCTLRPPSLYPVHTARLKSPMCQSHNTVVRSRLDFTANFRRKI